jgi:hypothetical protein
MLQGTARWANTIIPDIRLALLRDKAKHKHRIQRGRLPPLRYHTIEQHICMIRSLLLRRGHLSLSVNP